MIPQVLPAFQTLGVKPQTFKTFIETEKRFYLPRYYGIENFGPPVTDTIDNGLKIDLEVVFDLLPHQKEAWEALEEHFGRKGESGIFSLFCGGGKTSLAIRLACYLKTKTLVVVNKEVLMDQWNERILQFTGGKASIGRIQQNIIDYQEHDFVLVMLHSLSLKEYDPAIFKEFGLTIVDECHHIAASTFSKALPKIASRYMLGLSATPERSDGLSVVFYRYMGPLFFSQKRTGTNQVVVKALNLKSQSDYYRLEYLPNGTKNTSAMVTNISQFEARNRLIVEILGLLVAQGRKILLLSARREQLEHLSQLLSEQNFKDDQDRPATYGLYWGAKGGNKHRHRQMLEESSAAQIILGTTNIAQEGLDIPELNTLFLISSLNDVEQASGRILRKNHERLNPLIIDLVDHCGNFPKHFKNRERYYHQENYQLQKDQINLDTPLDQTFLIKWLNQMTDFDAPPATPVADPLEIRLDLVEPKIIEQVKEHTDKGHKIPLTLTEISLPPTPKIKNPPLTLADENQCLLSDDE